MRLLSLSIDNFGVFGGRHDFDLTPTRKDNGEHLPLVVFSGQNGVGKSTLFQAMSLALHGSLALGDRVSRQTYSEYLLSRLHRYSSMGIPFVIDYASVSITFQYVQSGQPQRISVQREWRHSGQQVHEKLTVYCDGKVPEVSAEDYQSYINEIFPPGLASVCFFDAEKLESLSNPEYHNQMLRDTLRRLLGLDYVERLQADLDRYLLLLGGSTKELDKLRDEIKAVGAEVVELESALLELKARAEKYAIEEGHKAKEIARQEERLAAEGGTYAARRPVWKERLRAVKANADQLTEQIREMCGELLPFALVPELCESLSQRLTQEAQLKSSREIDAALKQNLAALRKAINEDDLWEGLKIKPATRKALTKRLNERLKNLTSSRGKRNSSSIVHYLSDPEKEKLQSLISQVLNSTPQQVAFLGSRLQELRDEQKQLEADLRRVPDEASLAPIQTEINSLNEELEKLRLEREKLGERQGELKYQLDEKRRRMQTASNELKKAISTQRQVMLAEHSRRVLSHYYDRLIRQRVAALEKSLVTRFNLICRKEHLIESAKIDPEDFTIELKGEDERVVDLSSFSAGERQLYALSVIWALREISGRQLPLAIDTPLARLDDAHRSRLLHNYLPAVSDQVLFFVTDAEMDTKTMKQVGKYTSRSYRLSYHPKQERTVVMNGKTKHLLLVNPETGDYEWDGIAELQRLTQSPDLVNTIKSNYAQIYDVWRDEWDQILIDAGYDTVLTVTIEGPEEYVLTPSGPGLPDQREPFEGMPANA